MITSEEFESLAGEYNVLPLIRSTLADLITPVSAYLALRGSGRPSFLLESVEPNEKVGRFSFVGFDPEILLRARNNGVEITERGVREITPRNIFEVLKSFTDRYRQPVLPGSVGFSGGFVGYLGYPAVAHLERLTLHPPALDEEDEAAFGMFTNILRFDHRKQVVTMIHNVILDGTVTPRDAYEAGRKALDALELRLRRTGVTSGSFDCDLREEEDGDDHSAYCESVVRAQRHIMDGDIFQTVLSRRVRFPYRGELFPVYRALRIINPSPYLFFLDFNETQLAGSSPEVLVRVQGRVVEVLPIAGTRRRGRTMEEDLSLEAELLVDRKELAEHTMLVDLGRNDIGRISEYGTVNVTGFKRVERYSHVMHIVSDVRGTLRAGLEALDALKACFPAGTVSGAPKVRAMEIINELEPCSRGAYAGAVGYIGFNGSLDTCIAIRTIIAHRGTISIQSGAGIVADSVPEQEYQETRNKARALLEAVRVAREGLREFSEGEGI